MDLMQSFVDDQILPTEQERYLKVWLGQRRGGDLRAISPLSARQVNALRVLEMLVWVQAEQERQPVTRSTEIDE